MFNPTIIRLCTFGARTAMVVSNSMGSDDHYFQIYINRPLDKTELQTTFPYGSQVDALNHFEAWAEHMDKNLVSPSHLMTRDDSTIRELNNG